MLAQEIYFLYRLKNKIPTKYYYINPFTADPVKALHIAILV